MYLLKLIKAQKVHFFILCFLPERRPQRPYRGQSAVQIEASRRAGRQACYGGIYSGGSLRHTLAHQKNNISKKSNMILKSLIYTDWKRFLIIMT